MSLPAQLSADFDALDSRLDQALAVAKEARLETRDLAKDARAASQLSLTIGMVQVPAVAALVALGTACARWFA